LGGNRKGKPRRYVNLMITMLLGGLWHGAGWTFVFWGGLHGLYLIATHGVCRIFGWHPSDVPKSPLRRHVLRAITFLAVLVAWVFFRATTFGGAGRIVAGMFGASGMATPTLFGAVARGGLLALTLAACWMLPNTQDAFFRYQPCLGYIRVRPGGIRQPRLVRLLAWRPSWQWAMLYGVPMAYCLMCLNQISEFIYYQF
jgi:alginate O-acetyltransferase complex protein AlgI